MIDGTCPPVVGLDSAMKTSSSTGARTSGPREAATPDSGSTRADGDLLPSLGLELRVRGSIYKISL